MTYIKENNSTFKIYKRNKTLSNNSFKKIKFFIYYRKYLESVYSVLCIIERMVSLKILHFNISSTIKYIFE